MTDNSKTLYLGHISQPIAKDGGCGASGKEVFFTAPIDLLPDDRVVIDPRSGHPLGVYRDGRLVWKFEGETYTGSFSGAFTDDSGVLAKLFETGGANAN